MQTSNRSWRSSLHAAGFLLAAGVAFSTLTLAGGNDKKSSPPPAQHSAPAPHPGGVPGGGPHPGGGFGGGAAHGPTTGAPGGGASHGPTTGAPHGPTTGSPGGSNMGHPTTSNPGGGAHPTTSNPGGMGGAGGAAAAGQHPGGSAAGGQHPGGPAGAGQHPGGSMAGGQHPGGGFGGGAAHGPTPSHTFAGHPTPAGGHEMHAANGSVIRTRADGSRADIHDAHRGMDIHHGLDGNRRVMVERADHSRVFAERGGRGYVQHPYMYHGHEFAHRTYWEHGHAYSRFYGRYPYHGVYLEVYAPVRYYPVGFYGWAYNPWVTPVPYAWGWTVAANPWYGYYGFYFAPYPVYAGPAFWLTDFVLAASLEAAYAAQAQANAQAAAAAAASGPVLTPDVKAQIAEEVKYDMQQERLAAQANAASSQAAPTDTGVGALLSDGHPHVFVAGSDLDVVDAAGTECLVTQGDVVQVTQPPAPDAVQVNAVVLASKGRGNECRTSDTVNVALTDLQEMQNHMRETIDKGMAELQAKQGKAGLPAAPAEDRGAPVDAGFAQGAPPPDSNAQAEITAQANAADQAEREDAGAAVAEGGPGAGPSGPPPTIALGQTIDQVTAAIGQPTRIVDLGAKKLYTYPDMKVTFMNGKVSDVQ